jgi:glycosyltransferase involved in cell wall biosynthesis
LPERIESIRRQTLRDWELIAVDSYSEDGTVEILRELAGSDHRVRFQSAPADGIYANLNRCVELARGEYVYIATSDDTMSADCLEKMVAGLGKHRECGLCHCCLTIISQDGTPVSEGPVSWEEMPSQRYFGDLLRRAHIRYAPHDGILHFCCSSVYTSLTHLLVRRRVFQEYGGFRTDFGSVADFEWAMRVSLNEDTLHLPEYLATWRRHEQQATQEENLLRMWAGGCLTRMTAAALQILDGRNGQLLNALQGGPLRNPHLVYQISCLRRLHGSVWSRLGSSARFACLHPLFVAEWLCHKFVLREKFMSDVIGLFRDEYNRLGCRGLECV